VTKFWVGSYTVIKAFFRVRGKFGASPMFEAVVLANVGLGWVILGNHGEKE